MDKKALLKIKDFDSLLDFLVEDLEWPIPEGLGEYELTFVYTPEEIGLSDDQAEKMSASVKQLRPFIENQPWAIFWLDFETKKMPVTVLRRILRHFVVKRRAANPDAPTWQMEDIMFVAGHGEEGARGVTFAHFKNLDGKEVMREFSWNSQEQSFDNYINYLDNLKWEEEFEDDPEAWKEVWRKAFTGSTREAVKNSKQLALAMAWIARDIRDRVKEVYEIEHENGALHQLYDSFREGLIHDMSVDQFADMYAQTMTYGLFTARTMDTDGQFEMHEVADLIPSTNPFLKQLFKECLEVGTDHSQIDLDELGIGRLVDLLDGLNRSDGTDGMTRILEEFGRKTFGGNEDPVIHFYEEFLKEYDQLQRVDRGVYYTPDAAVDFMVRSVNEQLKTEFGLEMGLADTTTWGEMVASGRIEMPINPRTKKRFREDSKDWNEKYKGLPFVQILDPATGTGTFLIRIITEIHKEVEAKYKRDRIDISWEDYWNNYVETKLFPRLYGFELMMASYSVAHMRIGMHLKTLSYEFKKDQRLNVYLTNTLESPDEMGHVDLFYSSIGSESNAAKLIKQDRFFTVIIGNPPYSINSANLSEMQMNMVEEFKLIKGERIKERGALQLQKNLNDDYVKFFAFAKGKIEASQNGLISFISNNNYVDARTMRGFRWNFGIKFNKIEILNLHGDSEKGEVAPDGSPDENIFDIKKGVCIGTFIKSNKNESFQVLSFDLFGTDKFKYKFLLDNSSTQIKFNQINSKKPYFLFSKSNEKLWDEYEKGRPLNEIFNLYSSGIITARDSLTIDFDRESLWSRVVDISNRKDLKEIREDYNIKKDSTTWVLSKAIADLNSSGPSRKKLRKISYRLFDDRNTYYTGQVVGFYTNPRFPVMQHLLDNDNLVLYSCKQVKSSEYYRHCFIANKIVDCCYVSNKTSETGYAFPLYIYNESSIDINSSQKSVNLRQEFIDEIKKIINDKIDDQKAPLEIKIVDYIYSILHSKQYRKKYKEFLKMDFPRVPYPKDKETFWQLVKLGGELRQIHLLESEMVNDFITDFPVAGTNEVTKSMTAKSPGWVASEDNPDVGDVWINDEQYFSRVPKIAWEFYIGGYQPAQKWLKDRKGRNLTQEVIEHYQKIIVALTETDRIMQEIDKIEIE